MPAELLQSVRCHLIQCHPGQDTGYWVADPDVAVTDYGTAEDFVSVANEPLDAPIDAIAADAPEITAPISALSQHQKAIGAGVVIGSNVFNLAALLGIGAIVAGIIGLHRKVVLLSGAVGLGVALVCLGAVEGVLTPAVSLGIALALLALMSSYSDCLHPRLAASHCQIAGSCRRWMRRSWNWKLPFDPFVVGQSTCSLPSW